MLQIPPEFILKTLKNAYEQYDKYDMPGYKDKTLKIYGFCDGLVKLIKKFAPEYTEEVNTMKAKSNISNMNVSSDKIDLEQPTIFRRNN